MVFCIPLGISHSKKDLFISIVVGFVMNFHCPSASELAMHLVTSESSRGGPVTIFNAGAPTRKKS